MVWLIMRSVGQVLEISPLNYSNSIFEFVEFLFFDWSCLLIISGCVQLVFVALVFNCSKELWTAAEILTIELHQCPTRDDKAVFCKILVKFLGYSPASNHREDSLAISLTKVLLSPA